MFVHGLKPSLWWISIGIKGGVEVRGGGDLGLARPNRLSIPEPNPTDLHFPGTLLFHIHP